MMRSWAVWEPSRSPLAALLKPPNSLDARQKDPKRDSRLPNKTSHIKPLCMTGRWGAYKPRWGPSLGGARGAPLMPPRIPRVASRSSSVAHVHRCRCVFACFARATDLRCPRRNLFLAALGYNICNSMAPEGAPETFPEVLGETLPRVTGERSFVSDPGVFRIRFHCVASRPYMRAQVRSCARRFLTARKTARSCFDFCGYSKIENLKNRFIMCPMPW